MSHAAKQIRDWFLTELTGVTGLPTPKAAPVRQFAGGTNAVYVLCVAESLERVTMTGTAIDDRNLTVQVVLVSDSFDAVDVLSVLAEENIASGTGFPGKTFDLVQRDYESNVETDRDYVSVSLTYAAIYAVYRNDVETLI
jgi:hypothetical protein